MAHAETDRRQPPEALADPVSDIFGPPAIGGLDVRHGVVPVVFRWLCQLKVAPYSYDLLDNRRRRSPQHLVPGGDRLVVGEQVMIFELASFAVDEHLTIDLRRHRVFGDVAITYMVAPSGPGASRLVVKLVTVAVRGISGTVIRRLLPAGDFVMMRGQLLNLKALAEASATVTEAEKARS